jgi:hypothetical protein
MFAGIVGTLLSLLVLPVQADDGSNKPAITTSFTDDFELRYWTFDERLEGQAVYNYVEQVNRLNALVGVGRLTFGAQIDQVALFANRYYLNDVLFTERSLHSPDLFAFPCSIPPAREDDPTGANPCDGYINVEKIWGRYEVPMASVVVGDFYAAFGRGIALNVNRNVDIDIDTSIQGVKAIFRPGAWDITALIGQVNRQQVFQDNPNLDLFGDRRHAVGAIRAERFGIGPLNLGAHTVVYDFVSEEGLDAGFQELGTTPDAVVTGVTAEVMGASDWYLEADVMNFLIDTLIDEGDLVVGYFVYAVSTVYAGPFTWLIEGKRYLQGEALNDELNIELYEIAIAPSLEYERAITEDSSAGLNSNDIYGGRVRMDWAAVPGEITPYASVAVFRDQDLNSALSFHRAKETIIHPMMGLEFYRDGGAIIFNTGVRHDIRDGDEYGFDRQIHADLLSKIVLPMDYSIDISAAVENYHWGVNEFQQQDYWEVESAVSASMGSMLTFTWFTDYTTNPLVTTTGNLSSTLPGLYGAAEIQYKPFDAVTLKAFYGAYKAGIRCSGGQCRQLPGFEGVRFSMMAAF